MTRDPSGPYRAAARPPFRYQQTLAADNLPSSSSTREKQPVLDEVPLDEKSSHPYHITTSPVDAQFPPPRSGRAGRGHARTSSRDDPHWQSGGASESRSRSGVAGAGDHVAARSQSQSQQQQRSAHHLYHPSHRYHSHPPPAPTPTYSVHRQGSPVDATATCCGVALTPRAKAWIPLGAWILTSLGFLVAIGWFKDEVFLGLEQLSDWIRHEGYTGQAILFLLIFITTFPPMPLYSTLIVLAGYCYGAYYGAVISYFAALTGAMAVFFLSRHYFRSWLSEMVTSAPTSVRRAIRAVEKQPKLLFLIRLSPYPYNLMNALLATSRITFTTYSTCTALSLFKVIVHTTIGASIHKFSDYHTHSHEATNDGDATESGNDEGDGDMWSKVYTIFGVVLCVAVLVYLSWVARRAVDDAEDDDDVGALPSSQVRFGGRGRSARDSGEEQGESVAFLSPMAQDDSRRPSFDFARLAGASGDGTVMLESPFRATMPLSRSTSPYPPSRS